MLAAAPWIARTRRQAPALHSGQTCEPASGAFDTLLPCVWFWVIPEKLPGTKWIPDRDIFTGRPNAYETAAMVIGLVLRFTACGELVVAMPQNSPND